MNYVEKPVQKKKVKFAVEEEKDSERLKKAQAAVDENSHKYDLPGANLFEAML